MDGMNGTSRIDTHLGVHERAGGGRRGDAEAFRRALHDKAGDGTAPKPAPEPQQQPVKKTPMRTGLQPAAANDRQQQEPRHIDVYA